MAFLVPVLYLKISEKFQPCFSWNMNDMIYYDDLNCNKTLNSIAIIWKSYINENKLHWSITKVCYSCMTM